MAGKATMTIDDVNLYFMKKSSNNQQADQSYMFRNVTKVILLIRQNLLPHLVYYNRDQLHRKSLKVYIYFFT